MGLIKIKSIQKKHYKGKVYNIAVKGDETYYANNLLVHNCRSLLIPIMLDESKDPNSYYYNYQDSFDSWGGSPRLPAKGFGGI